MKTLLLASGSDAVLRDDLLIRDRRIADYKIAWITTAAKVARDRVFLDRARTGIAHRSLDVVELDIEGLSSDVFRERLRGRDAMWMEGGNAFYLLKVIQDMGLADTIRDFVSNDMLYIGTSAGAYVACPTIEMCEWGPDVKPRFDLSDLRALGLVPFLVRTHATPERIVQWKSSIARSQYPVRMLADGQALLIEDNVATFLGADAEFVA